MNSNQHFDRESPLRAMNGGAESGSANRIGSDTPTQAMLYMDDAPTLVPGHKLGSFLILQHIASGGMGQVYRASDQRLGRDVAIKILPRAFARDRSLLFRFQAEARAASSLNHPNIVAIHDIGWENDLCWTVSEFIDGQSLRRVLEAEQLSPRRVIDLASQIAEGLSAAHAAGFIHRDLKPENIMLTHQNRVKILDFGIAKSAVRTAAASVGAHITQEGVVLGTPGYMSPEQIAGDPVDQRSDIFSLGIILYEMLTRTRPFAGPDGVSIMQATLTKDIPALPLSVPAALARITERCLEKQPQRRLQSATDVAFSLQMVAGSTSRTPIPWPRWPGRRIPGFAWAVIACAAVAAAMFWAGLNLRPVNPPLLGALRRITWDDGLTGDGAISPDGRFVAYSSDRANGRDLNIFVQQVDGAGTLQLTNDTLINDEPNFSPDGARIAFESRRGADGIYEVPALGGKSRLIAAGGRHPRFSPDGHFMLYSEVGASASRFGGWGTQLFVEPIVGGTPTLITKGCVHVVAQAVWSPDSQQIMSSATCDGVLGLWLFSRDGNSRQRTNGAELWAKRNLNSALRGITFQELDQWLTNPPRLLLPLTQGDTQYEVTVPISSGGTRFLEPVNRINFGPGRTLHGSASATGRVALTSSELSANLWQLPIDSNGRATGEARQITRSRAVLVQPNLSPDGRNVAFVLAHDGRDELQVMDLASHAPTAVTLLIGSIRHPVYSLDGSKISFESENADLQIGAHGGAASEVFPRAAGRDTGYVSDWSKDGRQFLWVGRQPAQSAISIVDRATSKMTPILKTQEDNLYQAHFSPNGKYITFNAAQKQHFQIYAAPVRNELVPAADWIPLTHGAAWNDKPRLSPNGQLLFFLSDRDGFPCIWVQRLSDDMHPKGEPEAVYHSHSLRRSLSGAGLGDLELNVASDKLIFTLGETLGNIWVLEPNPQ